MNDYDELEADDFEKNHRTRRDRLRDDETDQQKIRRKNSKHGKISKPKGFKHNRRQKRQRREKW